MVKETITLPGIGEKRPGELFERRLKTEAARAEWEMAGSILAEQIFEINGFSVGSKVRVEHEGVFYDDCEITSLRMTPAHGCLVPVAIVARAVGGGECFLENLIVWNRQGK